MIHVRIEISKPKPILSVLSALDNGDYDFFLFLDGFSKLEEQLDILFY